MSQTKGGITEEQIASVLGMKAQLIRPGSGSRRHEQHLGKIVTEPEHDGRAKYKFLFVNPFPRQPDGSVAYANLYPKRIQDLRVEDGVALIDMKPNYLMSGGYLKGYSAVRALRELREVGL